MPQYQGETSEPGHVRSHSAPSSSLLRLFSTLALAQRLTCVAHHLRLHILHHILRFCARRTL